VDVVVQRLERRDIQNAYTGGEVFAETLFQYMVDSPEKCGEGLS
jgi:hypothetical protein